VHKKLTIQDIARLAGVSKATVSRVLNRNPSVAADLNERVMRVVREHDFVPNITATGLAGGRTRLLGVLAPPLTWPAVPEIMRGVAEYIEKTQYEIVLYSVSFSFDGNHSDVLDGILAMRMVSGLLAIFPGNLFPHLTTRFHEGLPLVMIDDQQRPANVPWVGVDNVASAYEATKHLLDLGYRRIAHMRGPQHYCCAMERYQGYCQALQDAGISPDPALLFQGSFDTPSGRQCAEDLFALDKSAWPEAIFVSNDQMAYGVLEIAEARGVRVPEELALVGFDDNILSTHMRPPLTTIRQPFFEMGSKAIEILLTMIDPDHRAAEAQRKGNALLGPDGTLGDAGTDQPVHIQLPTSLVVRASSGAPRTLSISP
jgi:LacI family transcriptional regulator